MSELLNRLGAESSCGLRYRASLDSQCLLQSIDEIAIICIFMSSRSSDAIIGKVIFSRNARKGASNFFDSSLEQHILFTLNVGLIPKTDRT